MEVTREWVQFEVPYLIRVEDSFEDNESARFQSYIDGVSAELRFKKEGPNDNSKPWKAFGQIEGDRLGNGAYTKVKVGFEQNFLNTLPNELQHSFEEIGAMRSVQWLRNLNSREGYIIRAAVDHVNQFLDVYRTTFGYYWIRGISPSEVVYFARTTRAENGYISEHGTTYSRSGPILETGIIDDEEHKAINARLRSDYQVPIVTSLRLEAQDKLDLGEYRLATITAETMFEVFLKESLRELMEADGMSDNEIESAFVRERDGDYKSISELATETVPKNLHFDFEETNEFKAWDEQTREKRNEVVHEGYTPSEDEARAAYDAANNAIEFLINKIDKRHEELRD